MAKQIQSVSRRAVLTGMTTGIAGFGALCQRSAARETDRAQQAPSDSRDSVTNHSSAWPQYRSDSGRSGVALDRQAPMTNFTPTWSLGQHNVGLPVVDADRIYVVTAELGGTDPWLKALSRADGSTRWRVPINNDSRGASRAVPPAVVDGVVYYSSGKTTRAFAADSGKERWSSDTTGSWLVVANDRLYLNGDNADFSVLDATDGSVVWERTDEGSGTDIRDKHAVAGGTLYLGITTSNRQSYALALDAATGQQRWKTKLDSGYPHMVATANSVFVATDTILYSLDPATGDVRWRKQGGSLDRGEVRNVGSPAVGSDVVYAPVDGTLFALDIKTGKQRWTTKDPGRIVVVGDTIYGITHDSKLVVIDATTGQQRAQYQYTGKGEFYRTLIPLTDMILVGLYRSYGSNSGMTLLALSTPNPTGTPTDTERSTEPQTESPTESPTQTPTESPTQASPTTLQSETATATDVSTMGVTPTDVPSTPPTSVTTQPNTRTMTTATQTTTNGPGFGVLSALAGCGFGVWRYLHHD